MMTQVPPRRIVLGIAVVAVALAANWRIDVTAHAQSTSPVALRGPYTVVQVEKAYDEAGIARVTNRYVQSMRSDGAKTRQIINPIVQERNIYLADGTYIRTDDLAERKTTYSKPLPEMLPPARDPRNACVSPADARVGATLEGQETIDGHPAARIVAPMGARAWTTWYALDLECAELQMRIDHESGTTERRLENVTLGEPDPGLFAISEAFKETEPSEFYRSLPSAVSARLDKNYYAAR